MIYNFSQKVPVVFGAGAALRTGLKAKELGLRKVLCVYDQGIKEAGIADKIIDNLKAAGLETVIFDDVELDPPDTVINKAAGVGLAENVDGIVAVGGGSAMDTAKGINLLLNNPPPISQYYVGLNEHEPGKVLILIPTTAGSGSEVTQVTVVSDTATKSKKGVMGPAVIATLAIVDPELHTKMPPKLTAATGMDAFAHAVESITSEGMNPFTDILAEKAITLIVQNLEKAVQDGSDINTRTNMALAALIAGYAFSDALPHWGHAIAHTLGAQYHISHGIGSAIALPVAVEYVADAVPEKVRQAGLAMGLSLPEGLSPGELGAKVADKIRSLSRKVGIPSLNEYKFDGVSLEELPPIVLADDCALFGPKRASAAKVLSMLEKVHKY